MSKEEIVALVLWTMKHYGSNAGDKLNPGSKLKSQAQHIADVIHEYDEACERLRDLPNVIPRIVGHK